MKELLIGLGIIAALGALVLYILFRLWLRHHGVK